jgi:hypothetical protein
MTSPIVMPQAKRLGSATPAPSADHDRSPDVPLSMCRLAHFVHAESLLCCLSRYPQYHSDCRPGMTTSAGNHYLTSEVQLGHHKLSIGGFDQGQILVPLLEFLSHGVNATLTHSAPGWNPKCPQCSRRGARSSDGLGGGDRPILECGRLKRTDFATKRIGASLEPAWLANWLVLTTFDKNPAEKNALTSGFVRPSGFEPETCGLRVRCSAVELEARDECRRRKRVDCA